MKKQLVIINTIITIIIVIWNGIAGSRGVNGKTVGELSDEYNNLITPDGYAFSIWGIIFIALLLFCGYQVKKVFLDQREDEFVLYMGYWYSLANVMNGLWLVFWLNEYIGLSVVVMTILLISLLMVVIRLGIFDKEKSLGHKAFVQWPIGIYTGWISIAIIANVASYLTKIDFAFLMSEEYWAISLIVIATLINLYMVLKRGVISYGLVGIWALVAISVRHNSGMDSLYYTSLITSGIIGLAILLKFLRSMRAA